MLDGYEELPGDLQEKVKLALEIGHIADEDWKGVRPLQYTAKCESGLIISGPRAKPSGKARIPLTSSEETEEIIQEECRRRGKNKICSPLPIRMTQSY